MENKISSFQSRLTLNLNEKPKRESIESKPNDNKIYKNDNKNNTAKIKLEKEQGSIFTTIYPCTKHSLRKKRFFSCFWICLFSFSHGTCMKIDTTLHSDVVGAKFKCCIFVIDSMKPSILTQNTNDNNIDATLVRIGITQKEVPMFYKVINGNIKSKTSDSNWSFINEAHLIKQKIIMQYHDIYFEEMTHDMKKNGKKTSLIMIITYDRDNLVERML